MSNAVIQNTDRDRIGTDTLLARVVAAVPLNGGCSPYAVTGVVLLEQ